jgi:NADPH-dependent glutamate synthase beta subunit-like oxidoreductase
MVMAVQSGNFAEGYKLFASAVPFPRIICEICEAPCEKACLRHKLGGSVRMREIEKACVAFGFKKSLINKAFLPKKSERVAIAGANLSGLTAAYYLRRKGYSADVYGQHDGLLDADLAVLTDLGVHIIQGGLSMQENNYDAIFLADGRTVPNDEYTLQVSGKVFAGNSSCSAIHALADGKRAVSSIERYLQGVSLTAAREKPRADSSP